MTQIVSVPQTVAGLTSSLGTSTSGQNAALSTAMVSAGILPSTYPAQSTTSPITTANAMGYNNGSNAIATTPVVWTSFTNPTTNFGSWNTSTVSLTVNGGAVSFPANSVFTFNRSVTALMTCQVQGYMTVSGPGGSIGMQVWNVLSGSTYSSDVSIGVVEAIGAGLTTFEGAYSGIGTYHSGDQVAVGCFIANLQSAGVTVSAAQYGDLASTLPTVGIINFN